MQMVVGYKLVNIETQEVAQTWGGTWGQSAGVPNPLHLPTGDIVLAPSINEDYSGYMLVEWLMDEPPPPVPESITRRQCALQLLAMQTITDVEALAMTKSGDVPAAIMAVLDQAVANGTMTPEQKILAEIDFAAANYYRSNSLISMMGLSSEQIDQFFIAAAKL